MTNHEHAGATASWPERTGHLRQVARIAPPELLGRDEELAELTRFCLEEDQGPYAYWQAKPWAGKSALMSTFVLNPPPELAGRVWLVAFFITARLASQNTRDAFVEALIEQLCDLLGQDLPVTASEVDREAALWDLLAHAAEACQRGGGRLVLVVDGLDEDRSPTTGPQARSIGGLLPAEPPAGMRIVVAGRLHPPLPDDVPDVHPLRDPSVVRRLADSPHARDLQHLAQAEIERLAGGTTLEQDVLGLVTAAGGGLSAPDLAELTGAGPAAVEDVLRSAAGRTFAHQASEWGEDGLPVYLFARGELHDAARDRLGEARLGRYRQRLHAWAETYRTPSDGREPWPANTPEYLLTGYPRMLTEAGETGRLAALAVDAARHDRMLDLSGGDAAAVAEIERCQDLLLREAEPDLYALALLSYHRSRLRSRNTHVSTRLPVLWAERGYFRRAEGLARSIGDPRSRAQALAGVAQAAAVAGHRGLALRLAADAERIARGIAYPVHRLQALGELVRRMAEAGEGEYADRLATDAEAIACGMPESDAKSHALSIAAAALALVGRYERAERVAHGIPEPDRQVEALRDVAWVAAAAGHREHARQVAAGAEPAARSITNPRKQVPVLTMVVHAAVLAGDREYSLRLAVDAERIARGTTNEVERGDALAEAAWALAIAGDPERAEQAARGVTIPYRQAKTLIRVARALVETGERDHALRLIADVEQAAIDVGPPNLQANVLQQVAEAWLTVGGHDRAERAARRIPELESRAKALTSVAKASADADERDDFQRLVADAEQVAREITHERQRAWAIATVARTLAASGDLSRAERLIRSALPPGWREEALATLVGTLVDVGEPELAERTARGLVNLEWRSRALLSVAEALTVAGRPERARWFAAAAEPSARGVTFSVFRSAEVGRVARAMAEAGDPERAERIARSITEDLEWQGWALAGVAKAAAAAGDLERARRLVADTEQVTSRVRNPNLRVYALEELAELMAQMGDAEAAARYAHSVYFEHRAWTLAATAKAFLAAGDVEHARRFAADTEQFARSITDPEMMEWSLYAAAEATAAAGDSERAERIARDIDAVENDLTFALALAAVAQHAAAAGDVERALRLAAEAERVDIVVYSERRGEVSAEVACALARAGELERAEQIACGIADLRERGKALIDVAGHAGPPGARRRLLGLAFVVGPWYEPLPELAKLDPATVVRVVDALFGEVDRQDAH